MKLETFKPLKNLVLVHIEESTTVGGLIIPDAVGLPYNEATVIKVGPGSLNLDGKIIPMSVKEGDRVMIPHTIKRGIAPIKFDDGVDYHLITESDIQAII